MFQMQMEVSGKKYQVTYRDKNINGVMYQLRGPKGGVYDLQVYRDGKADFLNASFKWERNVTWRHV